MGVGLCQLLKESLAHSTLHSVHNFSCWNKASNSIQRQMALGNSENSQNWLKFVKQLHPLTVCHIEVRTETKSKKGCVIFQYTMV